MRGAMDRLCRNLELVDLESLLTDRNDDDDDDKDTAVRVAQDIPLEVWNRFAELDHLPRGLQLRQLVWANGDVSVVEFTISRQYGCAVGYILRCIPVEVPVGAPNRANLVLAGHPTYSADITLRPLGNVPGIQVPQGLGYGNWVTVIIQVLDTQDWASAHVKLGVYRRRPGIEYIFFVKMSEHLNHWSYEFYDVPGNIAPGRRGFDIRTVAGNHEVEFDTARVLGLGANGTLPGGCPATIVLDMVALAHHVRASV